MRWRSFLVVVAAVAAGGVAALEFSARSAAVDIARALEPLATLTYESAGVAADGSIRLQDPRLVVKRGIWQGTVRARLAKLRGAGPLWLLGRFFSVDGSAPDQLHVVTSGLRLGLGASDAPLSGWLGTSDLALFENIGCGSDALSDKDRKRMGVETLDRVDQFDYEYDASSKLLRLSGDLHSPDIADIHGFAEVSAFDAAHWQDPKAQIAARLTRAGLAYRDSGYLARRNNFCAQWLGISSSEFVKRHLDALEVFLAARGIVPSREVRALYEQLVTRGGNLSASSLPEASWAPVEIGAYPREDLLRQLNVTVRLGDAPPIMLRLAFSDPDAPLNLAAVADPSVNSAVADEVAGVTASEVHDSRTTVAETVPETVPAAAAAVTVPVNPVAVLPSADAVGSASTSVVDPAQTSNEPPAETSPPAEAAVRSEDGRRVIASAPPPPQNSTLALVWKPGVIERLPEQSPKQKDYVVVASDRLGQMAGSRVAIVTTNGKQVEGEVKEVVDGHLVIEIQVGRGLAELNVPLNKIREVRVPASAGQSP
jgi:hypothetical protein